MVDKKAINYYRSFYDVSKDLNQKQFYDFNMAVYQVLFFEVHIDEIEFTDKMLSILWKSAKHSVRASVDGYCTKKGTPYDSLFDPLAKPLSKPLTNKNKNNEQVQEKEQVQGQEEYPNLNAEAFKMWCSHKGRNYSKQAKTIAINKMVSVDKDTQLEMVESSIMNGWKGLFVPTVKEKTPTKLKSFMDMKEYLSINQENLRNVDIEYGGQLWKIGKLGVPYSKDRVDDMPFDERKGFWLWLISNKDLLKVSA